MCITRGDDKVGPYLEDYPSGKVFLPGVFCNQKGMKS